MDRSICAIGEIGMDCYWSKEFIKEQEAALKLQLELADRLNLPVIIHSRDSTELIINVLKDCRHLNPRGVFHAYSGSAETFRELQRLGDWYIGIGGVLTYKKASIAEYFLRLTLLISLRYRSGARETKAAMCRTSPRSSRSRPGNPWKK